MANTELTLDDRVERLINTVDSLEASLGRHTAALEDYKATLNRKVIRATIAVAIAVFAALVGLGGAITAVVVAVNANGTSDRLNQVVFANELDRAEARVSACVQDNVRIALIRAGFKRTILSFVPGAVDPATGELYLEVLNATQRASFDVYAAATDASFQFRKCDPQGIAEYYRNPPRDPALPS